MSQPVTIEDIYKLFQVSQAEADRREVEANRREAEAQKSMEDLRRTIAQSIAQSIARSEADANRRSIESNRREVEANRREAEAQKSMEDLRRTVAQTSREVANLTTRWGRFVEELVEPAVLHLFQERGIDIKEVYPRARVRRQGIAMEIDILAVDDTELVLVECKSRLSKDDVDEFLTKLVRFKDAFPHYRNYRAYGAVAGIEIDEGIDRYAYRQGLFVICPSGDVVKIANDRDFQPCSW